MELKLVEKIRLPKFFENLSISYDGITEPKELKLFEIALGLVAEATNDSSTVKMGVAPNVYFVEATTLSFVLDKDMLGCFHQAIVFPVSRWKELKLRELQILFIMVEELCHVVWQIPDGPLVEEKVAEIFQRLDPDFSYADFARELKFYPA